LEHFSEVNGNTLTDSFVDWVFKVEFFKSVVARVQNTQDTNHSIMVDFIVAKVQREQLIMSEEQLSYHHGSIGLNFVAV
jgi:hypothetical protein